MGEQVSIGFGLWRAFWHRSRRLTRTAGALAAWGMIFVLTEQGAAAVPVSPSPVPFESPEGEALAGSPPRGLWFDGAEVRRVSDGAVVAPGRPNGRMSRVSRQRAMRCSRAGSCSAGRYRPRRGAFQLHGLGAGPWERRQAARLSPLPEMSSSRRQRGVVRRARRLAHSRSLSANRAVADGGC
jgi:hypothetical protein